MTTGTGILHRASPRQGVLTTTDGPVTTRRLPITATRSSSLPLHLGTGNRHRVGNRHREDSPRRAASRLRQVSRLTVGNRRKRDSHCTASQQRLLGSTGSHMAVSHPLAHLLRISRGTASTRPRTPGNSRTGSHLASSRTGPHTASPGPGTTVSPSNHSALRRAGPLRPSPV